MNHLSYEDALARVAERGTIRGADAVMKAATEAADGLVDPDPGGAPPPAGDRRHRRVRLRAVAAIGVAAAVLAGLLMARQDPRSDRVTSGTTPPVTAVPGPRLTAGEVPPGLVPYRVLDDGDGPAPRRSPRELGTRQLFRGTTATGAPADLELFIAPRPFGSRPLVPVRVRGVDGSADLLSYGLTTLNWRHGDLSAVASSSALSLDELRVVVEALGARGDDAFTGFDAPTEPVAGIELALAAEHVSTRDESPPAYSAVSYRDPGDHRREVRVEGHAPVSGASLDLITIRPRGERRTLAGAERVVADPDPRSTPLQRWTTVSWILADGSQAVVRTRGLDEEEVATVVGRVATVDGAGWLALRAAAEEDQRSQPRVESADLAPGRLLVNGAGRDARDNMDICLEVQGVERPCGTVVAISLGGSPEIHGPSGLVDAVSTQTGTVILSAARGGRWFLFGRTIEGPAPVVAVSGSPVAVSSRTERGVTLFALEVPPGTERLDVRPPAGDPLTLTPPKQAFEAPYVR